jgi:hypothetical protein
MFINSDSRESAVTRPVFKYVFSIACIYPGSNVYTCIFSASGEHTFRDHAALLCLKVESVLEALVSCCHYMQRLVTLCCKSVCLVCNFCLMAKHVRSYDELVVTLLMSKKFAK